MKLNNDQRERLAGILDDTDCSINCTWQEPCGVPPIQYGKPCLRCQLADLVESEPTEQEAKSAAEPPEPAEPGVVAYRLVQLENTARQVVVERARWDEPSRIKGRPCYRIAMCDLDRLDGMVDALAALLVGLEAGGEVGQQK